MNVLQILPELNVGGVETGTVDLARYLVRYGHKSIVISAGGNLVQDLEKSGSKHYLLSVHKKSLSNMIKMIPKVVEIIKNEKIDVVHARSRVPAWIAFFAARKTNTVFITTAHGHYSKHFFSRIMGWGKLVITPSNVIARHMCDSFAVAHERLRLIPRSVDLEKFKFRAPKDKTKEIFNIGIIGRITPIKGHLYFLKAMARVIRLIPRIRIWIVGDASASKQAYKEEVRIMVRRLGLSHCTEFLGVQKDIPAVLSNLDLLVLSSVVPESFGRVIVEAQASGVPVVASKVGGVVDIIDDQVNGLLVPPADPKSLAKAVVKIARDPHFALRLANNAYKKVKQKFNVELMVKRTLDVYKEATTNFKILVIKLSSLGDVVLSSAALNAIREKYKDNYKITLLSAAASKEIFVNCPQVDELLVFSPKDKSIKGIYKLASNLAKRNFDIVIDLQNNRLSHLLAFLSLAPKRYGYNNKKLGFLLNNGIKDDLPPTNPIAHQFRILKMLNIELKDYQLKLWPSVQDQAYIEQFLNTNWISKEQVLIGVNMFASKRWRTKAWPQEKIIRLCEQLALKNMRVVLTGTEKDLKEAKQLQARVKNVKPIIACGKTSINQLACLISKCAVFVTADSAPLHIACAVGTAFVALFGPTDSTRHTAPNYRGIILKKDLSCNPCYKTKCKPHQCMEKITVGEVLEAIEKLVK